MMFDWWAAGTVVAAYAVGVAGTEYRYRHHVQPAMTDRNRIQLLEYLEEMRALSRPVKQVKLTTAEITYLVALCNQDVFGRTPTQGKGGPAETNDASRELIKGGEPTLEGSPSTPEGGA